MKLFVRFTSRIIRPHSECVELAGIDITLSPVVKVFHVKITLTRSNMYLSMLRLSSLKPAVFLDQILDVIPKFHKGANSDLRHSDFLTMI